MMAGVNHLLCDYNIFSGFLVLSNGEYINCAGAVLTSSGAKVSQNKFVTKA